MRRAALAVAGALLFTARAPAEPTLWQRVKDPNARVRAQARLRAEQLFEQASSASDPLLARSLSLGSAALLELSGGASRDPQQAVLLGRILLEFRPERRAEAVSLIEGGLGSLPEGDFKRESSFDLGLGALLAAEYEHAARAFSAALRLAWDPNDRASAYRNRAKAHMLSGRLSDAVKDFRAAVGLARDVEVLALAHFGLGVALERSGDLTQGLQEMARGLALRLPVPAYSSESAIDSSNVRWIPEYDVHYFRALAAMSQAAEAETTSARRERYQTALDSWAEYLPAAEGSRDRFLANAQRLRQRCVEALAEPERRKRPSGRVR